MSEQPNNGLVMVGASAQVGVVDLGAAKFSQAQALVTTLRECLVTTQAKYDEAAPLLKSATKLLKELEDARKVATAPYRETVEQINALAATAADPLKQAQEVLKQRMGKFQLDLERAREAAARKAAEEQAAREARAAEEQAMAAEMGLPPVGTATDGNGAERAVTVEILPPAAELPPAPAKNRAVAMTRTVVPLLVDVSQVPREWMSFDMALVRAWMVTNADRLDKMADEAGDAGVVINGVKFTREMKVKSR